jgi:sterol desaturase/sphingolipid hydroxylase (fatty acid hydroxylase superfamily)
MDLTVVAVPGYVASMVGESRYLRRRAARTGPSAGEYRTRDTLISLSMGATRLVAPLTLPPLMARLVYGRERRVRRTLLLAVAGGVVLTSVTDRLATLDRPLRSTEPPKRRAQTSVQGTVARGDRLRRRVAAAARAVGGVTGVATIALGATTVATVWARSTTPEVFWRRRLVRDLGDGLLALAIATLGWDLIYYWNHRFMHTSRFMWAIHVVHHSSDRYNLSTALRQPVAHVFGVFLPTGALALLGIRPEVISTARAINLAYQYWIHTEVVDRLGPLERLLNSPSHHRVHHGRNPQYIDRNHGSILIVWDRLFKTFEPERDRPVYGLTDGVERYNPAAIVGSEYRDLLRDVARGGSWRVRLSHVLRGPGWSPVSATREQLDAPTTADLSRTRLACDERVPQRQVEQLAR